MTLVHLISLWARRLGEDGYPSDIFLHSILQSAGPASARACHAPDERLVPDTRLSQPQPTDSTLDSTPSPSFATLRRPNNDNTVAQAFPLQSRAREGFTAATACPYNHCPNLVYLVGPPLSQLMTRKHKFWQKERERKNWGLKLTELPVNCAFP